MISKYPKLMPVRPKALRKYSFTPLVLALLMGVAMGQTSSVTSSDIFSAEAVAVSETVTQPAINPTVAVPQSTEKIKFSRLVLPSQKMTLLGIDTHKRMDFTVRQDEIVTQATLELTFTPSPSLIPDQSQLKVYLNNELMGAVSITNAPVGQESTVSVPINPLYLKSFNQFEFEFVGSYRTICVNPANPALWLDINKEKSVLAIGTQRLQLKNDLAYFPAPFFEANDRNPIVIPFVLPSSPSLSTQRAAGVLASWFGVKAAWRQQSYPVTYDSLPLNHSIVFATPAAWPAFLGKAQHITGPSIEMIDHPADPFYKLLVVMGRDDADLITAAKGIAQGNTLFRGQRVTIDGVTQLAPRKPYDAPNWVRTDRPMLFSELQEYQGQLESKGRKPDPIRLNIHLPPDLYLIRNTGINVDLKYRYSIPTLQDQSRLDVRLNQRFINNYLLKASKKESSTIMRLPVVDSFATQAGQGQAVLSIPELKLGSINQLEFDFSFASIVGSAEEGLCQSQLPVDNFGTINDQSTIDFSGYRHYIEMPDLHAFAEGGFPFSRMADLSETTVLIAQTPSADQVGLLLNTLAMVSAQTGYPTTNFTLVHDWQGLNSQDKQNDILVIGQLPSSLQENQVVATLIDEVKGFVKAPSSNHRIFATYVDSVAATADSQVTLSARGSVAAIIGVQSPFASQRSVVALLANDAAGYNLIGNALNDSGKRPQVQGTAVILRESGINSLRVGNSYFVGHLPWWEMVWHTLTGHPILLALLSVAAALISALLLWRILRALSYRRIEGQ